MFYLLSFSLWLNEGFAHYMQYLGAHHAQHNDSAILDRFVIKGVQSALEKGNVMVFIQAMIAQLVAYRLGTREVLGSNPGKGQNFSVKISNWIV